MSIANHVDVTLAETVQDEIGMSVNHCYQCGKCSAGCPAANEMDFAPSIIMRLLQTREAASEMKILGSYTIWLCLACHTCDARCPMDVDLPRIMDILRAESLRRKVVHRGARDIIAFHKSFLHTIRHFGRMWEVGLVAGYKLRTRHFWQDIVLAPLMLKKGKLALLPSYHKKLSSRFFSNAGREVEQPK
ncbi:MAG TPA: 4Fe-4S dicluster domain-containing protein [Candidatus Acidoferrales bacterium]|nr:4Fe-4S dicluster domain-containing protein [Candidatus Acidoferrales bacterium]